MCEGGVSPVVSAHMYKVAIQPISTYGCLTLNVSPCIIDQLDKYQAKLIKSLLYSETCDGVVDTISALLTNYNYNSKMLIKQLLSPYQLTQ